MTEKLFIKDSIGAVPLVMPESAEMTQVQLLMEKYATSRCFSRRAFRLIVRDGRNSPPFLDEMVVSLTTHVLTQKLESREHCVVFDVPATWWDHLKRRLGWGRVNMRRLSEVVRFEVQAAYPEATIHAELGKPVVFSRIKSRGADITAEESQREKLRTDEDEREARREHCCRAYPICGYSRYARRTGAALRCPTNRPETAGKEREE